MKRREPKLPRGPKPARVLPASCALTEAHEIQLAERIARMMLARLRVEAPDLFAPAPSAPAPAP